MKRIIQILIPVVVIFTSLKGNDAFAKNAQPIYKAGAYEQAKNLIEKIEAENDPDQAVKLSQELIKLRPAAIAFYEEHLRRTRSSSLEERRAILTSAGADTPNSKGRFKTPGRETKKTEKSNDKFDWLTALAKLSYAPGIGETISDVAVLRALAFSKDHNAGYVIVSFAFSEEGLIYRDECGRYLRIMSPYSLPALIHGSQSKNKSIKRYTRYQLERLDRQNSDKAFGAATSEDLKIAILTSYANSGYREAVFTVLSHTNHVAPRVRKAAREAWTEYISGVPPHLAPKRKLKLPNGKQTKKPEFLWMDHRSLANVAIRTLLKKLTGTQPPEATSIVELTKSLFSFYDAAHLKKLNKDFEAGLAMHKADNSQQATKVFDRILTENPNFAKRNEMAAAYLKTAEEMETASQWKEAAIAYGKVSAIAPDSSQAQEALKKHHLARAQHAESKGEDASTERAIAEEVTTNSTGKKPSQKNLFLFAGLSALAMGLILLMVGLLRRRRNKGA